MAAHTDARKRELAREYQAGPAQLRRKGKVVVASGFGVRLSVERGRLVISDGAGRNRRERTFPRVGGGIARLVVLGGSGSISLAALRWASDLGIPVLVVDRDGRVLTTSGPVAADARLRRAQAFAITNPAGLEIARYLLGEKLRSQHELLSGLADAEDAQQTLEEMRSQVEQAVSLNELLFAERDAAMAYWQAWAAIPFRFRPSDRPRLPEQWLVFGQRGSPLSSSARLAVNPANALLNYCYALLEAESRTACLAVGLDPALGIVHADVKGRDSLPLDLMEAVRPHVDAYVLDLIQQRTFRADSFHETGRGSCRILPPLTEQLAATCTSWAALIAPVAERTAAMLAKAPGSRIDRQPTPLSSANRKNAHATEYRRPRPKRPPVAMPACKRCGQPVPTKDRTYCNDCLHLAQRERYAGLISRRQDVAAAPGEPPRPTTVPRSAVGADSDRVTSRLCKTCGDPVPHRKRVYCDACFAGFQRELVAMRRPCKRCGEPVPHRKRTLCDACLRASRQAGGTPEPVT